MTADPLTGPRVHGVCSCNGALIIPEALLGEGTMNLTYPVDALVSYHYYKSDQIMSQVVGPGHLRLIGDSGAFSAYAQGETIRLADYAAWCAKWRDHLAWVAALDVIGDPAATWKNWVTFRDDYGIDSIPTLHAGGDVSVLDAYAAEGVDFIGLGGLVGVANRAFGWLVHILRYARDHHPEMRFHAWGVTNRRILDALPVYSTDSSGIMGGPYRYGRLRLFDPRTGRDIKMMLDGRQVYAHRTLLQTVYGADPAHIARSVPANRRDLIQLTAASVQQYAGWLQARHHVTPPTWGMHPVPGDGTRVHAVVNRPSHTGPLQPDDDLTDMAPGPHVHLVDGSASMLTAIGPRLHHAEQKGELLTLGEHHHLDGDGPRVHVTSSHKPEMLDLTPEEPAP